MYSHMIAVLGNSFVSRPICLACLFMDNVEEAIVSIILCISKNISLPSANIRRLPSLVVWLQHLERDLPKSNSVRIFLVCTLRNMSVNGWDNRIGF